MSQNQPDSPPTGPPVCYRHTDRESHIRCQRCGRPICPDCMRDASVGFQCPSCVAEGAKATRSGRTTYGGKVVRNPGALSLGLIAVNVAVWLGIVLTGGSGGRLMQWLSLVPQGVCTQGDGYYPNVGSQSLCDSIVGATWVPGVADGAYWQLLTAMFTHVAIWHILANMIALYSIGPELERWLGRARFLALYLLSGLAGSALVLFTAPVNQPTVGASGAIFGLLGAILVIAHKMRGNYQQILMLIAINAVITFVVPNISWQAHVGGFVAGAAIGAALAYAPRTHRTPVQVGALATFLVVILAASAVRIVALA